MEIVAALFVGLVLGWMGATVRYHMDRVDEDVKFRCRQEMHEMDKLVKRLKTS